MTKLIPMIDRGLTCHNPDLSMVAVSFATRSFSASFSKSSSYYLISISISVEPVSIITM
jgi:hypothetical protein